MSTADSGWWLTEAGEYVLGTLRGTERDLFEKVLERDADAREHVAYWEQRLSDLELSLQHLESNAEQPVNLPTSVWDNIAESLDKVQQNPRAIDSGLPGGSGAVPTAMSPASGKLIPPTIQLRRWRSLAVVSLAASLAMGAFVLKQQFLDTTAQAVPTCLLYTSPSPRDATLSRMPSSA